MEEACLGLLPLELVRRSATERVVRKMWDQEFLDLHLQELKVLSESLKDSKEIIGGCDVVQDFVWEPFYSFRRCGVARVLWHKCCSSGRGSPGITCQYEG
jgi:hypothetical protein